MKKILLVSDSPYATTGLGRMSKYFLKMLPEFEWTVWGAHHPEFHVRNGVHTPIFSPDDFEAKFQILSPKTYTKDQLGLEIVPSVIDQLKPDYVITSMDYDKVVDSILEGLKQAQFSGNFKWINYFPIDREDYKMGEASSFRYPDVNVCITKFGQGKIKEQNPRLPIKQIYHPIDASEFPEIKKKHIENFRSKTFKGVDKTDFLIGSVNRSFARKDTPRLVRILSEYFRDNEGVKGYIHGGSTTYEGLNLYNVAKESQIRPQSLFFLPESVPETDGVSPDDLNKIYRSMDLFLTVSTGEGFGFTTVEAMLTKTPIIAPHNTSFTELVQDFGYLIPTAEMAFHHNGNTCMWPLVNTDAVKEKITYVRENYDEAQEKANLGAKWVKDNLNLDVIANQWREILV